MMYVGDDDGTVWGLDSRTGTEPWWASISGTAGTLRFLDGRLYIPSGDAVITLRVVDGSTACEPKTLARTELLVTDRGVSSVSGTDEAAGVAFRVV